MTTLHSGHNDLGKNPPSENSKFLLSNANQRRVVVYHRKGSEPATEEDKEKDKSFCKKYAGLLLTLFCAIISSLGAVLVKFLKGYHPFTLAFYRFQGLLWPSLPLILYGKIIQKKDVFEPVWPLTEKEKLKTLVLIGSRGALGCCALVFQFYALQYLTAADTLIIGSCKSVFVILLSCVTLKEKCSVFLTFVAFLTMLGVGIILRPPIFTHSDSFDESILIGAGYALCGTLASVFAVTVIRRLRKVHFAVVTGIGGISGTVISLSLALCFGVFKLPENSRDWLLAVCTALFAFLVQTSLTLALKYDQAGPLTLVRTSDTVFAFIWQFFLLDVSPDIFSIIGAAVVIFGVLLTAWNKFVSLLPPEDTKRKRFGFVLK